MRASRLLSILLTLQTRGRVPAEALAREFEVSIRTIYRDVDQLSAAGVPVYSERGRSGGFQLHEGYRTRLTGLTPTEAEALLLAGMGGAAADLGVGQEAAAAQLKMLAALPPDAGANAQRVGTRFHLDPAPWYARIEPLELLPTLASAVWRDRRIRIGYESWSNTVTRDLDPLGLVLKAGVWYLIAVAKDRPRTYRVSNIRSLDLLDKSFQRPARFNLARHWSASAKEFEARLLSERAIIRISLEGRRLLRDNYPAAEHAVATKHTKARPAGWVKAEIPVEDLSQSVRQLLRLGAEIEVLGPPALRKAMAEEAGRVVGLYR